MSAYLDWQVGDRVVCVYTFMFRPFNDEAYPEEGSIYTIRDIELDNFGRVCLRLVEIVNPKHLHAEGFAECSFAAEKFRKVQPRKTDIAIFERFLNDADAPIREEA